MAEKIAACHCQKLTLDCQGEPMFVVMCHCQDCQRRTGSSYNLGVWYEKDKVVIQGEAKTFERVGDGGSTLRFHFCPHCGTNIYWESPAVPTGFGIAGGCFADPDLPAPAISLYEKRRHRWVNTPEGATCFLDSA